MLIDYLEKVSLEIAEKKTEILKLNQEYNKSLDKTVRDEILEIKKWGKKKGSEILEEVYRNLEEFRLIKKLFPKLYESFSEDENIGKIIKKLNWLASFEQMKKENVEKKMRKLKKEIKDLDSAVDFIKKMPEPIDVSDILSTWDFFEGRLNKGMDKTELSRVCSEIRKELRQNGWILLLNEPFIIKRINKLLFKYNDLALKVEHNTALMNQTKGMGILQEEKTKKEFLNSNKELRKIERLCLHMLMANPAFLETFKKQKIFWREKNIGFLMHKLLEKAEVNRIKESEFVKEVKKKLEN